MTTEEHNNIYPIGESQLARLDRQMKRWEEELACSVDALEYLDGRGLTEESVTRHRLGQVGSDDPYYEGKLAIPYLSPSQEVWTYRLHCFDAGCSHKGHGKYQGIPEDPLRVFNVRAIVEAFDEIHVCEGEFDAIILNQCGFPAIGLPGGQSWKPHYRDLLAGFSSIFIWADPDDTGRKMAAQVEKTLRQAVTLKLPADVNDIYLQGGKEALQEILTKQR